MDNMNISTGDFIEGTNISDPIEIQSHGPAEILLFAWEPLWDPVYHSGPFVMDSEEWLNDAFREYMNGNFGKI